MLSSRMLLGLLVMSFGQSVIRDSMIPCMTQRTLGILTLNMTTDTSTMWLHLGAKPSLSQLPQCMQGVYIGVKNSPLLQAKLAHRIRHWEFLDTADLLLEVRFSDREGESENSLQKRPHCIRYMVMATLFWDVCVNTGTLLSTSYSRIDGIYVIDYPRLRASGMGML